MLSRNVLITGANRGLGFATAAALLDQGHRVFLGARTLEKAQAAAHTLREPGAKSDNLAFGVELDVTSDASVSDAIHMIVQQAGPIDILINNAGAIFDSRGTFETSAATMQNMLNVNTLGAWRTMRLILPQMNQREWGRVVNVSSGMGQLADMGAGHAAYRASKAALNALTIVAANAAVPGVKVNAVCPGWVRTELGGTQATRSVEEGIVGIVWAATLPESGPSGGFFRDGKRLDW